MNKKVEVLGKSLDVTITRRAMKIIATLQNPLSAEMELLFSSKY